MNRMVGWLKLDGSLASSTPLERSRFQTPHWIADHQAFYVKGGVAMSATQRFITPECKSGRMPFEDPESGLVINADVYLTNRESLLEILGGDPDVADAILVLWAYRKWGKGCARYLAGQFCFMIWDPQASSLFAAVDPFAHHPLFYLHRRGHFLMVANECSPFHTLNSPLELNPERLMRFSQDAHSPTESAYREVQKLPPGYQLMATRDFIRSERYWSWNDYRRRLPYSNRREYYAAFQEVFARAVEKCTRRIGSLTSQLSGGLDSSAVTAQAAAQLAKTGEPLTAFTILPNGLAGQSFRPGWVYHELPRVEELLQRYPNIKHVLYSANSSTDIFEKLKPLQPSFDQPLRNINNFDWTLACYEEVLAQKGRVLLIGAGGNGTISWTGQSRFEILRNYYLTSKARILGRNTRAISNLHEVMLSGILTAPLRASVYPLQLWYGVRRLDPTQELDLAIFCYNVPSRIYRRGKNLLDQRLLTREGLPGLLPPAIARNPNRGEQGADWYLHYNQNRDHWRDQLLNLRAETQAVLWRSYDRNQILSLFDRYPVLNSPPDRQTTRQLSLHLFRCLSMAFFLRDTRGNPR